LIVFAEEDVLLRRIDANGEGLVDSFLVQNFNLLAPDPVNSVPSSGPGKAKKYGHQTTYVMNKKRR